MSQTFGFTRPIEQSQKFNWNFKRNSIELFSIVIACKIKMSKHRLTILSEFRRTNVCRYEKKIFVGKIQSRTWIFIDFFIRTSPRQRQITNVGLVEFFMIDFIHAKRVFRVRYGRSIFLHQFHKRHGKRFLGFVFRFVRRSKKD